MPTHIRESCRRLCGGKTLRGKFVPQNVVDEAALQGGMTIEVSGAKVWNTRLVFWKWWFGGDTEVRCRANGITRIASDGRTGVGTGSRHLSAAGTVFLRVCIAGVV